MNAREIAEQVAELRARTAKLRRLAGETRTVAKAVREARRTQDELMKKLSKRAQREQMSKLFSQAMRLRWQSVPKKERAKMVPRNGGRGRKYPECPRYRSHMFHPATGVCTCGYAKPRRKLSPEEIAAPLVDQKAARDAGENDRLKGFGPSSAAS